MDSFEESDHAFVIRIWKENREIKNALPTWRGMIEHVRSGKQQYLQDLTNITVFIIPYLKEMGVDTENLSQWTEACRKLRPSLPPPNQPDD